VARVERQMRDMPRPMRDKVDIRVKRGERWFVYPEPPHS
jgi:hypothetical protein